MENNYSDIEKLAELRDKGLLTEQEFQQKKTQLLESTLSKKSPSQSQKQSGCFKWFLPGLIIIIAMSFLVKQCDRQDTKTSSSETLANVSDSSISDQPKSKEEKIKALENIIDAIKADKDKYPDTMEAVGSYLIMFEGYSEVYEQYRSDQDKDVQKKASEFKRVAGDYQVRLFPKMRKTYINEAKDKLWRSNIEVGSLGGNHTTIQLTGGSLANNANKEDAMNAMSEMVNKLRFKRVNMKWYKYDDEYTYYDLKTKSDSEL